MDHSLPPCLRKEVEETRVRIQIQLAATVEFGSALLQATYCLEGDGHLLLKPNEEISALQHFMNAAGCFSCPPHWQSSELYLPEMRNTLAFGRRKLSDACIQQLHTSTASLQMAVPPPHTVGLPYCTLVKSCQSRCYVASSRKRRCPQRLPIRILCRCR